MKNYNQYENSKSLNILGMSVWGLNATKIKVEDSNITKKIKFRKYDTPNIQCQVTVIQT